MEYALLIALALGVLLIVLAWLMVTIAGFRHHFVTGIVGMIPVLNLLILPTIWHRAKGWFFAGLVGLALTIGAWIGGANTQAGQHMQKLLGGHNWFATTNTAPPPKADKEPPPSVTQTVNMSLPIEPVTQPNPATTTANNSNTQEAITNGPSAQHELPSNALYQMSFQPIEIHAASQYIGQSVRIMRSDQKRVEGRLLGATDKMLRLEQNDHGQTQTQEIETKYIQSIEVLKY